MLPQYLIWAEKAQLFQHFFIGQVLQPSDHSCGPPLNNSIADESKLFSSNVLVWKAYRLLVAHSWIHPIRHRQFSDIQLWLFARPSQRTDMNWYLGDEISLLPKQVWLLSTAFSSSQGCSCGSIPGLCLLQASSTAVPLDSPQLRMELCPRTAGRPVSHPSICSPRSPALLMARLCPGVGPYWSCSALTGAFLLAEGRLQSLLHKPSCICPVYR